MRFKLIGLICLIMQCNLSCTQHIINKETVQTLDLHRYMGKWFEIARFDHRFEHNLVGATVEYSFLPNGDIEGSPDKPGGLSIQLCKSEKKEFYIRYSS